MLGEERCLHERHEINGEAVFKRNVQDGLASRERGKFNNGEVGALVARL